MHLGAPSRLRTSLTCSLTDTHAHQHIRLVGTYTPTPAHARAYIHSPDIALHRGLPSRSLSPALPGLLLVPLKNGSDHRTFGESNPSGSPANRASKVNSEPGVTPLIPPVLGGQLHLLHQVPNRPGQPSSRSCRLVCLLHLVVTSSRPAGPRSVFGLQVPVGLI